MPPIPERWVGVFCTAVIGSAAGGAMQQGAHAVRTWCASDGRDGSSKLERCLRRGRFREIATTTSVRSSHTRHSANCKGSWVAAPLLRRQSAVW